MPQFADKVELKTLNELQPLDPFMIQLTTQRSLNLIAHERAVNRQRANLPGRVKYPK